MTKYKLFEESFKNGKYPSVLYKYRDWSEQYHDRWIKNREILMSAASSFSDPMDCKVPIRYDLLNQQQTLKFGERLIQMAHPEYSREKRRQETRNWVKKNLLKNKKYLDEFNTYYFKETDLRRGILCLTEFPCLERMWNEYANNFMGFCIGYNSSVLFEFLGGGGPVTYDTLPVILPEPIMERHEIYHKQIFIKENKWEHENEYRTLKIYETPVTIEMRQIELPKEAYNKVILGPQISPSHRNEIIISVHENIGDIPVIEFSNVC
jgi:hypothetical protein